MTHEISLAAVPDSHQDYAARLSNPAVITTAGYRARLLAAPKDGSDARIVAFGDAFLKACQDRGYPMVPHVWRRDLKLQRDLFAKGVTKARAGESPHNYGYAVDLVHFGRWWDLDPKEWGVLGLIGKETARKLNLKVTWGGDWNFYDPAHWELAEWKLYRDAESFIPWPEKHWRDQHKAQSKDPDTGDTFAKAFRNARKSKLATFVWRGKEFTTATR